MKLISWNVNGIRACLTKGFEERFQELDADIMASTYGLPEIARMLDTNRQNIYSIAAKGSFELIRVGRHNRATKESFMKWYQNQTRYQLAEDRQERS